MMSDIFQPQPFPGTNGPDNTQAPQQDITRRQRGPRRGQGKEKKATTGRRGRPRKTDTKPENQTGARVTRTRKPREMKVELGLAMGALVGLSEDDAKLLTGIVQAMQPLNKRSRQRIVNALYRLV